MQPNHRDQQKAYHFFPCFDIDPSFAQMIKHIVMTVQQTEQMLAFWKRSTDSIPEQFPHLTQ